MIWILKNPLMIMPSDYQGNPVIFLFEIRQGNEAVVVL